MHRPDVALVPVDEVVLERLVAAATSDATAGDVTPPLTPGEEWTPGRVAWLRAYHRERRTGLDGEAGEATWAVVADGEVVGAVRLARVADDSVLEAGVWLTRAAHGRGLGLAALRAVVEQASALSATAVRAETTPSNGPALGALGRLGFRCTAGESGSVRAELALSDDGPTRTPGC